MVAIAINRFGFMDGEIWYRIDRGAIFCQVSKIMPDDSGIPWVTSGIQKWKGDSPNFIAMATVIMFDEIGLGVLNIAHCPVINRLMIIPNMKSMDAVAWVRKYFVDASMARGLNFFIKMGMMASMFISNPIQIINQWELISTMIVPEITVNIMVFRTRGLISMGRG